VIEISFSPYIGENSGAPTCYAKKASNLPLSHTPAPRLKLLVMLSLIPCAASYVLIESLHQKGFISQAPVVHTCNPRYSGGRDQEGHSSKLGPDK
jgi:hypothetical protein